MLTLDLDARSALVEPFTGDYYTQPKKETMTAIEETLRERAAARPRALLRAGQVTEQVVGYQRKSVRDQSTLDLVAARPPRDDVRDRGDLVRPGARAARGLEKMPKLLGTLHAAEHAMIALLPLWAMCDRWDIGGLSTNLHFQTGRPTIFVYDGHSGGVGITERGFDAFEGWVGDTAKMLDGCPCEPAAPHASSRRSAATSTSRSTRRARWSLLNRMLAA